ncbi:MAG TPA: hypothetical protein VGS57_22365 [Thermoanaerobaculia bacterium]|jgi:hypothetical protein|nr:hypothetical protein [Thermoanaerobaculia bacterium]
MKPMLARHPRLLLVAALVAAIVPSAGLAQEHPEHPQNAKAAGPALTKDQLADAITTYVGKESHDGWYAITDPTSNQPLKLRLDNVHRERLARVAPDTYFACADFVAEDGTKYDLDFFMKGTEATNLAFSDVSIHKRNGVERYRWREQKGLWKKEPVPPPAG